MFNFLKSKIKALSASAISIGKQIDSDDHLYRRLGGQTLRERDLQPYTQQRMIVIAAYLYEANCFAKDIIDGKVEFGLGEGVAYVAEDEKVQKVLDDFWNDPVNQMARRQFDFTRELGIFGELCLPVAVNKINGHVRLGYADAKQIKDIKLSKNNVLIPSEITLFTIDGAGNKTATEKRLRIIKQNTNALAKSFGYLTGQCFYFAVNKLSNSKRGRSDLLVQFDMLDAYDQFMWTLVEKSIMMNMLVWDVEIDGMDQKELDTWKKKYGSVPKAGSVLAHNSRIKWNAIVPNFKDSDPSNHARLFLSQIACGARKPRHYMGMPEDTNRALGSEMSEPTQKNLKVRQGYYEYIFTSMFNFQIDQKILSGQLKPSVNRKFKFIFPAISSKSLDKLSRGFERAVKAVAEAIRMKVLTEQEGREIISTYTAQLGTEIDLNKKLDGGTQNGQGNEQGKDRNNTG